MQRYFGIALPAGDPSRHACETFVLLNYLVFVAEGHHYISKRVCVRTYVCM